MDRSADPRKEERMRLTTAVLSVCVGLSFTLPAAAAEGPSVEPTPPSAIGVNLGSTPLMWLIGIEGAVLELDYERRLGPHFSFVVLPQLAWARIDNEDPALRFLGAASLGARLYPFGEALQGFHVGATAGVIGRESVDSFDVSPVITADLAYNFTPLRSLIFSVGLRGIFIFPAELPVIWPRLAIAYAF